MIRTELKREAVCIRIVIAARQLPNDLLRFAVKETNSEVNRNIVICDADFCFLGRLFPFDLSEPLVGLAALADVGIGIPYFVASGLGLGGGDVRAVSYEYGNAFAIVAGLLNVLVIIDAYDVALGRK